MWKMLQLLFGCYLLLSVGAADAHEGHDHDKPPPLNLPVAPRVVAVTPDFELVGVSSGRERLTIFLHAFATNTPIKGAKLTITAGDKSVEAVAQGDGVFTASAAWLAATKSLDLVFVLTLADDSQDLLSGQLKILAAAPGSVVAAGAPQSRFARMLHSMRERPEVMAGTGAGLLIGVLGTLLALGRRSRRREERLPVAAADQRVDGAASSSDAAHRVTPLRRGGAATAGFFLLGLAGFSHLAAQPAAADAGGAALPSVPATMATDLAQRLPDGTLFVPKATQHLLSIRTMLTTPGQAQTAIELTGTVIAAPGNLGRVQPGRPGRIEAALEGLAYVGKRVEKGQLLGYVQSYIEAADRATLDSTIAETEARIAKNRVILSRYEARPGAVPQVKVDEVRGELDALTRKRAELVPRVASREPILAPISGVVSLANATVGQIVEARDILFEIVDPSEFWIEAHGHGHESHALQNMTAVYATSGSLPPLKLEYVGRSLALKHQASILTFKIAEPREGLSLGMPFRVIVQSSAVVDGFIMPASAIVRGHTGLPIVWIKTEPERFEPQTVKVAPLDGTTVVVSAGLKEDQRVVTDGVTLLNQVR